MDTPSKTAHLLNEVAKGTPGAAEELWPFVYGELRKSADRLFALEPKDHTLQPTALVHETYIRLVRGRDITWQGRAEFFSLAVQAMRRILIDHARRRGAARRGRDRRRDSLVELLEQGVYEDEAIIALDDALNDLTSLDPELGRIVELRYFGGLSVEETAEVLGISGITVKRRWRLAKGWLHRELSDGG